MKDYLLIDTEVYTKQRIYDELFPFSESNKTYSEPNLITAYRPFNIQGVIEDTVYGVIEDIKRFMRGVQFEDSNKLIEINFKLVVEGSALHVRAGNKFIFDLKSSYREDMVEYVWNKIEDYNRMPFKDRLSRGFFKSTYFDVIMWDKDYSVVIENAILLKRLNENDESIISKAIVDIRNDSGRNINDMLLYSWQLYCLLGTREGLNLSEAEYNLLNAINPIMGRKYIDVLLERAEISTLQPFLYNIWYKGKEYFYITYRNFNEVVFNYTDDSPDVDAETAEAVKAIYNLSKSVQEGEQP